jgi:hypothetical protein
VLGSVCLRLSMHAALSRIFSPALLSPCMPGYAGGGGGGGGSGRKVFVANLNYQTEWQHLKDHFKSIGNGD